MRYTYTGKNMDISQKMKDQIEKKLGKLDKFFHTEPEAKVTISEIKKKMVLEITIWYKGVFFRAEEMDTDLFTCIDNAIDIIERQIRRNRTKLEKRIHKDAFPQEAFEYDEDLDDDEEFKVLRSKKISYKPMDVEEAILQMNLIGHAFFMFHNAESGQISVVYKRKDGNYGLIETE